VVLAAVGLVACGGCHHPSALPAASPSGPPVLGLDWGKAGSVERPVNYTATLAPSENPEHPRLIVPGQAYMADVLALTGGSLVSVGYVPPDWTATAWTSANGTSWALHPIESTVNTFAVAVAAAPDGHLVAVGRSASQPVAWSSPDGSAWTRQVVPVLDPGTAERMTSVVATAHGFLAGGSAGPELTDRHARFWTSTDGATWQAVADDPAAFDNAEVRAIARAGAGFVAIGVLGRANHPTRSVAWRSNDGEHWTRVDDPAFTGGVAVAVVGAPFGGLVAVGSDLDRREAVVWTSADGARWTRVAGDPARTRQQGFVWMTDVAAVGDMLIAIGDTQPLQRSTGTAWVSRDGSRWEPANPAPVLEQSDLFAITPGGPGAVAVGDFGGPDSAVPTVWLTPAR